MLRKIASQSFLYFAATLVNRALNILLLPILTRFLGPADYGILSVTGSIALFLGLVASLSLENVVLLFHYQLEPAQFRRFMSAVLLFLIVEPLVLVGLISVIGWKFGEAFFPQVPWRPYLELAVWITYVGVLPAVLLALLRAKQWPLMHSLYTIGSAVVTAALTIYLVAFRRWQVLGSLWAQLIGGTIASVVACFALRQYCRMSPRPEFDWRQLRVGIRLSLPYLPYAVSIWLLNISDRWILSRYCSMADVGIYSLAYSVGLLMIAVGQSMASAFGPQYYEKIGDRAFRDQLPRLAGIYSLVPTWIALALSLMAPELLRIAATPPFYGAARLIPFITLAYWIHIAIYQLQILVLEYHRRQKWLIWLSTPAAVLNIGLNLALIPLFPQHGIFVAAFSTIAGFTVMASLGRWFARMIDPIPFPWSTIGVNVLIAAVVFSIGSYWLTLPNLYASIASKGLVLLAAGLGMMFVCGFRVNQFVKLERRAP